MSENYLDSPGNFDRQMSLKTEPEKDSHETSCMVGVTPSVSTGNGSPATKISGCHNSLKIMVFRIEPVLCQKVALRPKDSNAT